MSLASYSQMLWLWVRSVRTSEIHGFVLPLQMLFLGRPSLKPASASLSACCVSSLWRHLSLLRAVAHWETTRESAEARPSLLCHAQPLTSMLRRSVVSELPWKYQVFKWDPGTFGCSLILCVYDCYSCHEIYLNKVSSEGLTSVLEGLTIHPGL